MAGTALFQQAKILDSQIADQYLPQGYQAHLITFQVNLQPLQRDYAYDSYTDITLMPADFAQAAQSSQSLSTSTSELPPVIVYPLVVMDAFEATNVTRSIQTIRQAALDLAGVVGGAGVRLGANGGSNRSRSLVGLEKNNMITVGRINESSLRVRIGAENSGDAGRAMVPRSYNVSVLVLVRWENSQTDQQIRALKAIANTQFIGLDGKTAPSGASRSRVSLAVEVEQKIRSYGFRCIRDVDGKWWWISLAGEDKMKHPAACNDPPDHQQRGDISRFDEAALNILRAVDRGDYAGIAAAIDDDGQNLPRKGSRTGAQELSTATLLTLQRLIPALAEIQSSSRYATMVIALKPAADTKLPDDDGYALYTDDGNAASVTIRGGSGLFGHKFSAYLENAGSRKLLASQVTLEGDGEAINVTFPSFAHIDGLTALSGVRLIVEMKDEKRDIQRKYELRKVTAADAEQKAVDSNPVSASHDVIVAVKGQATVRLRVGGLPAELGANMPWHLEVTGAEVRGMDQQPVLKANSVMALALEHLSERRPVLIKTADAKNKAVGSPLSFSVEKSGE